MPLPILAMFGHYQMDEPGPLAKLKARATVATALVITFVRNNPI